MAGAADSAFRAVCVDCGAAYTTSEMISAQALVLGDGETRRLMKRTERDTPFGIQLFGSDPSIMGQAARIAARENPDFIDINMGCPAYKITRAGAGSRLMCDEKRAAAIVAAVCEQGLPVTVKLRSGYDRVNAAEVASACEKAGARGIVVHPRTREQQYAGRADHSVTKAVKNAVSVPVVGCGDIKCGADARDMLLETGCDGIMIGRAALGNPFVFSEVRAFLANERYTPPDIRTLVETLYRQMLLAVSDKGERTAMLEMRKHAAWYLKGFEGAAALRASAVTISTLEEARRLLDSIK